MSNQTNVLMQRFAGFDGATVDGRNPKLNEGHMYVLECLETYIHNGQRGECLIIESKVIQSSDPSRPAGSEVSQSINNLFSPTDYKKKGAWGQCKGFCAAIISQHPAFNPNKVFIHPDTPPEQIGPDFTWTKFLAMGVSDDRVGAYEAHKLFAGIPYVTQMKTIPTSGRDPSGQHYKRVEFTFWAINNPEFARK